MLELTCEKPLRRSSEPTINHLQQFSEQPADWQTRVLDPQHTRNCLVYNPFPR
jgi:hypothetical protein